MRDALLETDPASAFNLFLGFEGRNTNAAIARTYVNLHNTAASGAAQFFTQCLMVICFPCRAGVVCARRRVFGERWERDPDSLIRRQHNRFN